MSFDQWNNMADVADPRAVFAAQHPAPTQHAQNTNTHGNFFTHLLPALGGTVGGVAGGATAGTALLPGVGTLVGALLGGALGGVGGKVAENKAEGQGAFNHPGDILKQGLEQGVLSAGPIRLLKGAGAAIKAAPEVATGAKTLEEALSGAGQAANKPMFNTAKNLVTQGQAAQGRVAGFPAGTKDVAAKFGKLSPQDTEKMLTTLKGEGIKIGNANNMSRDISTKLNQYGDKLAQHFTDNNTQYTPEQVKALADEFMKNVTLGGMKTTDKGVLKEAQTLANDLQSNVTDKQSLWKFRRSIDNRLPDAKQATDVNLAKSQAANKSLRQFIAGKLGEAPGMNNYSKLADIQDHVLSEANRLNNPTGGIIGRVAASGPVQKTEQLLGKATETAGKTLAPQNPFNPMAVASRTLPLGVMQAAAATGLQNPSMATTANTTNAQMSTDNMGTSNQNVGDLSSTTGAGQSQNPYGQENLLYDISRDPAHADKYLAMYNSFDKIFNPANSQSAVAKPSAQQYGLASSAMDSINKLSSMIQQNPDVVNKNATPGQGLPIIGGLISNAAGTADYHTQAGNVAQAILHLETGAAFSKEEKQAVEANLPRPGDSPEVIQNKLNTLSGFLAPFLSSQQSSQSSPADLASALTSMGYGQ